MSATKYRLRLSLLIHRSVKYTIPKAKNTKVGSGSIVLEKKTLNGSAANKKATIKPVATPVYFFVIKKRKTVDPKENKTRLIWPADPELQISDRRNR